MRVDRHLDHRGWYPSAVRRVRSPLLHDRGPMARRSASQTGQRATSDCVSFPLRTAPEKLVRQPSHQSPV